MSVEEYTHINLTWYCCDTGLAIRFEADRKHFKYDIAQRLALLFRKLADLRGCRENQAWDRRIYSNGTSQAGSVQKCFV